MSWSSADLKVLRDVGLVEVRPDAQRRQYRLRPEPLQELDAWLEPYREQWSAHLDSLSATSNAPRRRSRTTARPRSSREPSPSDDGTRLRATYSIPDLDMGVERGDLVGLHYSLDRLVPALSGEPVAWDNDAFTELQTVYADLGPAEESA